MVWGAMLLADFTAHMALPHWPPTACPLPACPRPAAAQAGGSAAVRSRGAVRSQAAGAAVAGHLLHNHRCEGAAGKRGWAAELA